MSFVQVHRTGHIKYDATHNLREALAVSQVDIIWFPSTNRGSWIGEQSMTTETSIVDLRASSQRYVTCFGSEKGELMG